MSDFAYGQKIETPRGLDVYQFKLNADVYRQVRNANLSDLRMYDTKGRLLPYDIRYSAGSDANDRAPVPVPVFPLMGSYKVGLDGFRVHIKRNKDGSIESVETGDNKNYPADGVVGYVVDLTSIAIPAERIALSFRGLDKNELRKITLAASDHLSSWKTLQSEVPLGIMERNGQDYLLNVFPLSSRKYRQIHISWNEMEKPIEITGAQVSKARPGNDDRREWLLGAAIKDDSGGNIYHFNTGGFFPVDQIQIKPYPVDAAFHVKLWSRNDLNQEWEEVVEFDYYNVSEKGVKVRSLPAEFQAVRDPYWRMELKGVSDEAAGQVPQLALGWLPDRVYFRAGNETAYILAYGNNVITTGEVTPEAFNRQAGKKEFKYAKVKERVTLSGNPEAKTEKKVNGDRGASGGWLKWVVLIVSILILAILSIKAVMKPGARQA